ncbi:type II toxin-antitoxin system HipA family toxin [Parasphingorhabdus cellanae]|uniref:Type II toxin-antitoxin system HipA family toxin n=1 Tax=Parasphingorhabdus cellanae TaxID=2806553 RepID=A0ABX7T924_9SPHN|nr:type II toxin-antitoxin system HipA family toxin [Parasphingorhabdus cellanae]QTD57292.1 type II toxin-antitoxin system HipA family toxin [Parasphingorhabdus cellanae]
MARRKTHEPLNVLINNRLAGRLEKQTDGAIRFTYDRMWLDWEHRFPISLSLPLLPTKFRGEQVVAVFDNLLPDSDKVRQRVAERTGAQGTDSYSLLERIGRDCVGAMQFLPDGVDHDARAKVEGEPINELEIEAMLANLEAAPLGIDEDHEFRISVAGAQEKTALLRQEGQWKRPIGTTPTTHILKPQIGEIPSASGMIDMTNSVENEHYCLKLMEGFGLDVAQTEVATFGARKVLVVERFDRQWQDDGRLIRLPQEDCCQALGIPSSRKYQSTVQGGENGPSTVDILDLLQSSDDPLKDQADFFKSQIIFWLISATDGHGKNFSIFLKPGGGFALTPFYDVLSAQPVFDKKQIAHNKYKLAMSVGRSRKYKILDVHGRHFVETAKEAGLGPTLISKTLDEIIEHAPIALDYALAGMPKAFHTNIHKSISKAIKDRMSQLKTAFAEI